MKKQLTALIVALIPYLGVHAQPNTNPIAEFYNGPEGYPAWTDGIKWNNVYNMAIADYSGCATCTGNDFEKFKYIRDIAYNDGGGVLYYPAGTYFFQISDEPNSEGLMLKKGVVIRGEKPSSDTRAVLPGSDIDNMSVTDHGLKTLPTKFIFDTTTLGGKMERGIPKMWNMVGVKKGTNETDIHEVHHVGICWVEIEYGYIYFGFASNQWAANYGAAGFNYQKPIEPWKSGRIPDGTHPMDPWGGNKVWGADSMMMGSKRFVFGVHIKNGGVPNYVLAQQTQDTTFVSEDGPWGFGSKIAVYGQDVFVANNVISKPTKCFVMDFVCGGGGQNAAWNPGDFYGQSGKTGLKRGLTARVPYDYGKGISIDINKNYVAQYKNRSNVDNLSSQYAPNVMLIDNWIYNHSNKGVDIGGAWMVIKNNINRRERYSKTDVYNLGITEFYGINISSGRCWFGVGNDDFRARAITLSPNSAWVDGNQYRGLGSDFDNSGEGILVQDHLNGSECFSMAATNNKGESYIGVWNSHTVGLLLGYNKVSSGIMLINHGNYAADVSAVQHVNKNTGIAYGNTDEESNITTLVKDYKVFDCSTAQPAPGTPEVTVKDTVDYVKIEWTNVENEAGYRVQRRRVGDAGWHTIAYRPRQETGGLVTFGSGPYANGFIATTDGHPPYTWDGKVRDMNPKLWRDYTKMAGQFEYRVVAVGCDDLDVAASDPAPVEVGTTSFSSSKSQIPAQIYPNPASEVLNISVPSDVEVKQIRLITLTGITLKAGYSAGQVDVSGLQRGIYIIEIEHQNGIHRSKVIIK